MTSQERAACWIATGGGIGYFPIIPATIGSLGGWALYTAGPSSPVKQGLLTAFLCAAGVWSGHFSEKLFNCKDARQIVIDEIAAMYLMLTLVVPASWREALACFILFRILDVLKPLGIRRLEALPRGWGIVADDLAAAIFGVLLVYFWRCLLTRL